MALLLTLFAFCEAAVPVIPVDDAGAAAWEKRRTEAIDKILTEKPEDYINLLARMLVQLKTLHYRDSEQKSAVIHRLETTLISIPGHAEFYDRRIRGEWEAFQEAWDKDPEKADASRFLNNTFYDFPVLEHLPSAENVRVLGEMILEPERYQPGEDIPNVWLAGKAVVRMHALPLVNKPVAGERLVLEADVETYRLWYSQIKAGTRTFRFEGDPNEYDLNGVVRTGAVVPVAGNGRGARVGDEAEAVELKKEGTPWQGLLAGVGLVLVAAGYWWWGRRRRS